MVIGFEGHTLILLAGGDNRCCKSGKDTTIFDEMVFSFLVRVGVNPFVGLRTVESLVGNVVVFAGPGSAAGAECSRR